MAKFIFAFSVLVFLLDTGTLDLGLMGYAFGSPSILAIFVALLCFGLVVGGLRWWLTLPAAGVNFSLSELLEIQLISAFVSTWLSGAAGRWCA